MLLAQVIGVCMAFAPSLHTHEVFSSSSVCTTHHKNHKESARTTHDGQLVLDQGTLLFTAIAEAYQEDPGLVLTSVNTL